ncbi:MAG: glycogen/starch/alpha-glucan phosphorylase [Deltaproteobacteria bacterium]|nr:glycogen/starch/alpha-glucan phosphorylase [Deltaproteobacteria bacterium]
MVEGHYLGSDAASLQESVARHMEYSQAKTRYTARATDWYNSLAKAVRDRVMERWNDTQQAYYRHDAKRVYYLSMEYLLGRTIHNALINLGLYDACKQALAGLGHDLDDLIDVEPDAGLGNGGLGRLAACFLDSMATLQLPATGYGIRYDYGIFEQAISDGFQHEKPDDWLRDGYPWEILRPEYAYEVQFRGWVEQWTDERGELQSAWRDTEKVIAVPYDVPVPGYRNETVNTLRLWSARAAHSFDLREFNMGEYIAAVEDKVLSENITKVLYPKDDIPPGRELRLKQEYFFVSATVQDILRRYKVTHDSFSQFPDKVAIQLNDTHPAIAIAELMRVFVDLEGLSWDEAWDLCQRSFGYTNHTVMPEALEKWPVALMHNLLPRHMQIIYEINRRFLDVLEREHGADERLLRRMSIIEEHPVKSVRMSHLAIVGSHSVNGVAALHTEIIKKKIFSDFHALWPERFNSKTNGITQRRWLKLCNPELSELIGAEIGDEWATDLSALKGLEPLAKDAAFRKKWAAVKREKKAQLARYAAGSNKVELDLDSIFDCQIKRIHEYKRQLLNVLHIATLYNRLKADPRQQIVSRSFLFGGKAAPGYYMAKLIIKLINSVAEVVNADPDVAGRIQVAFLSNYSVSLAQKMFPGSDLSEQISTAGYEASGTGNMKFALNGALTIGTLDGANIEIREEVGEENIFIFGLRADEVTAERERGYAPRHYYETDPALRQVIDQIASGHFCPAQPDLFRPIVDSLLIGGDHYMLLRDYASYVECQERVAETFRKPASWQRMSILNTARVGKFSSDRTISEYADEIWAAEPVAPLEKKDRG